MRCPTLYSCYKILKKGGDCAIISLMIISPATYGLASKRAVWFIGILGLSSIYMVSQPSAWLCSQLKPMGLLSLISRWTGLGYKCKIKANKAILSFSWGFDDSSLSLFCQHVFLLPSCYKKILHTNFSNPFLVRLSFGSHYTGRLGFTYYLMLLNFSLNGDSNFRMFKSLIKDEVSPFISPG